MTNPSTSTEALSVRLTHLREVTELSRDRIAGEITAHADRVLRQATDRLALADGATVVACAGATGSGKSSLFNAVSDTTLATPGVRRPTTCVSMAAAWGPTPTALLDWLDIKLRHQISGATADWNGLVLLDLPDHDSNQTENRAEVDRLVAVVDRLIWVVDPQKYADAALHERYLRPMATHAEIMTVALNKADTLTAAELAHCLADLRRLLNADGLKGAELLAVSTVTGTGIAELRAELVQLVAAKTSATNRLYFDINQLLPQMAAAMGAAKPPKSLSAFRPPLVSALGEAVGVSGLVAASRSAVRWRGNRATGWPLVNWVGRFRADPARRLSLPMTAAGADTVATSSVSTALRTLVSAASVDMPPSWVAAVDRAARIHERTLPHQLTEAVAGVSTLVPGHRWWWSMIRALQWALIAVVVAGLGWLALNMLFLYFGLPLSATFPVTVWPDLAVPTPTLMVGGGLIGGLLLALVGRFLLIFEAGRVSRRLRRTILTAIGKLADSTILAEVTKELERYAAARKSLAKLRP